MREIDAWWIPAEDGGYEREYIWPFVNREFEIKLWYGGDQSSRQISRISQSRLGLIFIDNSVGDLGFLDGFPPKSIAVFLVSDETYSSWLTLRIARKKSVKIVYRDYPLRSFRSLRQYPRVLFYSIRNYLNSEIEATLLFRAFFAGLALFAKQIVMRIGMKLLKKSIREFPLGYTNSYCREYSKCFNLKSNVSLVTHAMEIGIERSMSEKDEEEFFSGQWGKFDRQVVLNSAKNGKLRFGTIHSSFGGSEHRELLQQSEEEYFKGLLASKYSICPPGNYSSETFRYLESILVGSYPLTSQYVLSDFLSQKKMQISIQEYLNSKLSLSYDSTSRVAEIRASLNSYLNQFREIVGNIEGIGEITNPS